MEQQIEIEWESKKVEITIIGMTYGDYKDARRKSIVYKFVEKKTVPMRDLDLYDEICMMKSIKKAPFEINLDNIRKLSKSDGEKIEQIINSLNR